MWLSAFYSKREKKCERTIKSSRKVSVKPRKCDHTVNFSMLCVIVFHSLLSCWPGSFSKGQFIKKTHTHTHPPLLLRHLSPDVSCVLVHNPHLLPSMLNCKYVYLLYLCFDDVINPFWVGVNMNALHATGARWNMMTSYKSKFNKLFYTLCTVWCAWCAVCGLVWDFRVPDM